METASQRFSTRAGFKPLTYFIKIKISNQKVKNFLPFSSLQNGHKPNFTLIP